MVLIYFIFYMVMQANPEPELYVSVPEHQQSILPNRRGEAISWPNIFYWWDGYTIMCCRRRHDTCHRLVSIMNTWSIISYRSFLSSSEHASRPAAREGLKSKFVTRICILANGRDPLSLVCRVYVVTWPSVFLICSLLHQNFYSDSFRICHCNKYKIGNFLRYFTFSRY